MQIDAGINEQVHVTIYYADGTVETSAMTRREAIKLLDEVAAGKRPGIKSVRW